MADINIDVSGTIQNPPKQFTFSIPAGGSEKVFYSHNYFRILALSDPDGVTLRFGQTGSETDVIGAGIGYELNQAVSETTIYNRSASPVSITVIVTIGKINDDRLNVSGDITVQNTTDNMLNVRGTAQLLEFNNFAPGTSPLTTIAAGGAAVIGYDIFNEGSVPVRVSNLTNITFHNQRGALILPNTFYSLDANGPLYANGVGGTGNIRVVTRSMA